MAKEVTIYSTPWCSFCHAAKEYFKKNDIEYIDKDVQSDRAALEEMVKKTGQMGVPVIDIDGEITIGFNQPRLAELLEIK